MRGGPAWNSVWLLLVAPDLPPGLGVPAACAALGIYLRWAHPSQWTRAADRAAGAALLARMIWEGADKGAPRVAADLGVALAAYLGALLVGGRRLGLFRHLPDHLFHHQSFLVLAAIAGWPFRLLLGGSVLFWSALLERRWLAAAVVLRLLERR